MGLQFGYSSLAVYIPPEIGPSKLVRDAQMLVCANVQFVCLVFQFASQPTYRRAVTISMRPGVVINFYISLIFINQTLRLSATIFFISSILAITSASGQPYYFRHYQVEDGLSYNSVLCSMQDRQGFMWFGTRDGLNRFDGYLFKSYKHKPTDKYSLGNNYVYDLAQDSKGLIWVGTTGGLYRFEPKSEKFSLVPQTANKTINGIVVDNRQDVWFLASGKLFCITRDNRYQAFEFADNQPLTTIAPGTNNELWLATETGFVARFKPGFGSFRYYNVFSKSPGIAARRIEKIWKGNGDQLYIGTSNHGVKLLNVNDDTYKDILTFDADQTEILARAFCAADGDNIWIGTESGIYIYNSRSGTVRNLKKNFHDPYSLSDNAVYTICSDSEGGMWTGTYFGGVNYFSTASTQFEKFFPKVTNGSLRGNLVREFCQDTNGFLWVGTEDAGLNRFDLTNNTFLHVGFSGKAGSIAYNNIHGLLSVGNELWIGTYQHGLDILDINTHKVIRHYSYGTGPHDLKTNFVNVLFKSRTAQIYLGTQAGLYQYNSANDSFSYITEVGTHYISSISEDHSGRLWVGTFGNGAYVLSAGKNFWTHFESQNGRPGSLSSNVVTDIFEDSRHRIWLCTENGGLCEFIPKRSAFVRYKLPAELSDKYLFNIIEDDKKRLWITSSGGLIFMDPVTNYLRVFTKADGLLNDQFNYRSAFKDHQGRLYFGSSKGFLRHNINTPSNFSHEVPLYITGIQIEDKRNAAAYKRSETHLPFADHITLGPGKTTFNIDFAALSYTTPGTTTYKYKLEGLDKEWTTLPANRRIYYTQVPSGNYTFKVRATVSDNGISTKTRELKITVTPPFYASLPAIAIYIVLGGLAVYFIFNLLHKRTLKKNRRKIALLETQKEREIYQAKIDFFTHVTHEIKTPLTLIKAPLEKVLQADDVGTFKNDLLLVNRNTDRLMDLVDQLLSFRRTEIDGYSLNFNRTNISSLLINLCTLFKESAVRANISFNISIPAAQLTAYVDQDAFNKILSNLLSNAVKYARSSITIQLLKKNEHAFTIHVKNDGAVLPISMARKIFEPFVRSDIHKDKPGTGIGLPLAKALVDLHQGTLEYIIEADQLNTFTLIVPFHQPAEMNIGEDEAPKDMIMPGDDNGSDSADKPIIMLVEDQKDFREFVFTLLIDTYHVLTAADVGQAKDLLSKHSVQLIVSDVMMPGIDGFEFCKQLKNDINFSHIPFILLTAKDTFASKIEGLDCGSDAFIEKPFSPKYLKLQIVNLLKNRSNIKAYYAHSPLAHLKSVAHSKADGEFLHKLDTLIKFNLARLDFDIEELADHMNMSRPTLYRKVKATTDLSPAELVTVTRLKQAAEMLMSGDYKIYEIAEHVGFTSSAVLGRAFQKQFGMSPSAYAASKPKVY